MINIIKQRGFTLIELLVTIGIIVILAALIIVNISQARMNGRDARRIADVASLQLALDMYHSANKTYPDISDWAADQSSMQTNWNTLSTALTRFLSPLPKDPLNKSPYYYYVRIATDKSGAIVKAKLETNDDKMAEDACPLVTDYYDVIIGLPSDLCRTNP